MQRSVGLRFLLVSVVLAIAFAGTEAPPARAAVITVTTTADELDGDGACALREAIRAANLDQAIDACPAGGGADTIEIPDGDFALTIVGTGEDAGVTGDLDISGETTLRGTGPQTSMIDGRGLDRVFDMVGNSEVLIEGLTIRGGRLDGGAGAGVLNREGALTLRQVVVRGNQVDCAFCNPQLAHGAGIASSGTLTLRRGAVLANFSEMADGGGIWSDGILTVVDTSVSDNRSLTSGGGIWSSGPLTILRSTLSGNTFSSVDGNPTGLGGGLLNAGAAVVVNSTFSNNSGSVSGHGTGALGGGVASVGSLSLLNVTITQNVLNSGGGCVMSAAGCGPAAGPGLYTTGQTELGNTILFGDTIVFVDPFESGPPVVTPSDCSGTAVSLGYNLIGVGCVIMGDTTGNIGTDDSRLGPLQDNGGDTLTHLPLPGSPVVDAGDPAPSGGGETACPTTDQRGAARPQDGDGDEIPRCDIGAVEAAAPTQVTAIVLDILSSQINLDSNGLVRVAVLSTADFDASSVDVDSVCFGDAEDASQRTCTTEPTTGQLVDVNGDGGTDLVLRFRIQQTGIDERDTSACLTGRTTNDSKIEGCDRIRVKSAAGSSRRR